MKRLVFYLIASSAILVLVLMLLPPISGNGRPSRRAKCAAEMQLISEALQKYQIETGEYPTGQTTNIIQQLSNTNAQGYSFLNYPRREGSGRYEFVDPWGTPYQIETTSRSNYMILSAGKNGKFDDRDDIIFSNAPNSSVIP